MPGFTKVQISCQGAPWGDPKLAAVQLDYPDCNTAIAALEIARSTKIAVKLFVDFGDNLQYLAFPSTDLPFSFLLSPTRRRLSNSVQKRFENVALSAN